MDKVCGFCDVEGMMKEVKSPQPDDRDGIEYVTYLRCSYCGADAR